jgi:predicted lipoprotein with Yx(FWY)xxD motif
MRRSALVVVVLALVGAGCSEGVVPGSAATTETRTAELVPPGPVTIEVADTTIGPVLTDDTGRSLYVFLLDDAHTIACLDDCRNTWAPVLIDGKLGLPDEVHRSLFDRRELDDDTTQLAIAGQPLYRYAGDLEPGDMAGQGLETLWYLVAPDGTRNTSSVPAPS